MAKIKNTSQWEPSQGRLSRSTIVSGIIAIVVIVGLFILFNTLPANDEQEEKSDTQAQEEQQQEEKKKEEEAKKDEKKEDDSGKKLPAKYSIKKGDSLWRISKTFYGTGYKWTAISRANNISNPDKIFAGDNITIPKDTAIKATHTVVKGDTLWDIAEKNYGSGSAWTKIKNANSGKIGQLANGNPLIIPGQVLAMP